MNFLYYVLGVVFTVVLTILYDVFTTSAIQLDQSTLINLTFSGIIAAVAFFIADILVSRKKNN